MEVLEVFDANGVPGVRPSVRQKPEPAADEVLIEVHAAGVTPTELVWYPTSHTQDGAPRVAAVPGHEFAGRIAALGAGVTGWTVGDAVYGLNGWFAEGAMAEYCLTTPAQIAAMPTNLSFAQAATVPVSALTAWQGLFEKGRLKPGNRVLIHGGGGAVGLYAVQLARHAGACVLTTASAKDEELLMRLGADEVIDYRTRRFEDVGGGFDLVFDTVGGETLERSFEVLNPGGRIVTIAASAEAEREGRVKDAFFIVEASRKELEEVGSASRKDVSCPSSALSCRWKTAQTHSTARSTEQARARLSLKCGDRPANPSNLEKHAARRRRLGLFRENNLKRKATQRGGG